MSLASQKMILFLDFDGVLHPVGSQEADYFCRLPLLERFLTDAAPGWRVVISSSWRDYFPLDVLKQHFSPGIQARIDGCTPFDDDRHLSATWGAQASLYPREIQIRHHLAKRHLPTHDWIALDDHGDWFRDAPSNPHLVLTDPATGLTEGTIARLHHIKANGIGRRSVSDPEFK